MPAPVPTLRILRRELIAGRAATAALELQQQLVLSLADQWLFGENPPAPTAAAGAGSASSWNSSDVWRKVRGWRTRHTYGPVAWLQPLDAPMPRAAPRLRCLYNPRIPPCAGRGDGQQCALRARHLARAARGPSHHLRRVVLRIRVCTVRCVGVWEGCVPGHNWFPDPQTSQGRRGGRVI